MPHTLILGGTRGLGREVARLLGSASHQVSVIGRREPVEADRGLPNVKYWIADLGANASLEATLGAIVKERGNLNYLVFCQRYRGSEDPWKGEIEVSLSLTKALIEAAQERFDPAGDKSVVMVSSVFGDFVGEGQAVSYHVGKAGMNQMMRYYAVNLGHKGIRVNAVTPFTFLKDESRDFYLKNEALHDLYKKITPLGRMGTSADSAQLIAFLCSPQSGFINGQNIYVDGGLSLVWPETLARKLTSI
ncbi:MAG: SDR family NAD(P)-dependent oxidoreductase [Gammaproteobacteria bacterium]